MRQPNLSELPRLCVKHRVAGRDQRQQGDPRPGCCCCAPGLSVRSERSKLVMAEEVVQQQQQVDISLGGKVVPGPCVCLTGNPGAALLRALAQRASSAAETCCFTKKRRRREENGSTAGGAAGRTALRSSCSGDGNESLGYYKRCLVHSYRHSTVGCKCTRRSNCDPHASLSVSVVCKDLACLRRSSSQCIYRRFV